MTDDHTNFILDHRSDIDDVFAVYHAFSTLTAKYPGTGKNNLQELTYLALGLAGESGEAVDVIKKAVRREQLREDDIQKLILELGDILYYWTRIAEITRMSPSDIMLANMRKLQSRLASGSIKDHI